MIRETPRILIDDTHIRKPTKVQVKSAVVIEATSGQRGNHGGTSNAHQIKGGSYLKKYQVNPPQPQFKPLVQVDPTLLNTNRAPLQNPRPGDYLLNKTASTEGIASKKSLELKKRYLLGEQSNGNKIQKSGSTSVLDSRIRSFQSNISECQKLLNPSNDISASMRTFLDRTKLGENSSNKDDDVNRLATTNNVLQDLKVEITIQKAAASSTASTDNEKENIFVNSKNELNKGMEYSDTINIAMQNKKDKIDTPTTPTNKPIIIETIDLITPEKCETPEKPITIIDLTTPENEKPTSLDEKENADSNKIADSACESLVHSNPDVSKDVKQNIPDILHHFVVEKDEKQYKKNRSTNRTNDENERLLNNSGDEEKMDSPEKRDYNNENSDAAVQIEVPNIPWKTRSKNNVSSATNSSWSTSSSSSSSSTSIEDIQHYILESTTSPDTNNTNNGLSVPRVEVHDTTGNLMQIDSLMIVDGKYIGDPEDLKFMEVPEGIILPETAIVKTTEIDNDEIEIEIDIEPITATPEPAETTIVETKEKHENPPPPLPLQGPPSLPMTTDTGAPKLKPSSQLKFDRKNENKIESLKHLPLIVEQKNIEQTKAVKPMTLNLSNAQHSKAKQQSPTTTTPTTSLVDIDKTPTGDLHSRGSDSETEATGGTGQVLTETELSDWTADDCISENFIDTEFVLNSNKGTIKRNKKNKQKKSNSNTPKYLSSAFAEVIREETKKAPVVDIESMFNTIDFDDIEFMDTGSEGSCAEAYSATNTVLLKNRGYMEFIENSKSKSKSKPTNSMEMSHKVDTTNKDGVIKRNQKLGIDYIEQGAYIMQKESNFETMHDLLKTPVNEEETPELLSERRQSQTQTSSSLMTQSLTDSSTLNDLEDDSLGLGLTTTSQTSKPITATTTTTEESEPLTIVTSPIESSSLKIKSLHKEAKLSNEDSKDNETPSSSDKHAKTQSTCSPMSATSSKELLPAISNTTSNSSSSSGHQRKINTPTTAAITMEEQLSYEEYVRALQQKVTQISTAGLRDSLDARKQQRRKSTKGDGTINATTNAAQTVIEEAPNKSKATETINIDLINDKIPMTTSDCSTAAALNNSTTQTHKVPEIPTLTRRLEELSKERTKQKDLIHDLVMDKLQSKKQLNAEKRLHRSRQRTLLTSSGNGGYSSCSSLSPTPKVTATDDTNCASKAHYHVSTAVAPISQVGSTKRYVTLNENNNEKAASSNVPGYDEVIPNILPTYNDAVINRQLPFSAHLDTKLIDSTKNYELNKTSSSTNVPMGVEKFSVGNFIFAKPKPLQSNLPDRLLTSSISTENLRTEARARARLMSNSELGLSPEDKKRLQCEIECTSKENNLHNIASSKKKSLRELKMSASKSVNDLVYISSLRSDSTAADENLNTKSIPAIADFTSDPNLLLSSTSPSVQKYDENTRPKTKSNRRQKDPDRRKSLIQSISSLFHKDKKHKSPLECNVAASAVHSDVAERTGTSGSNTTASGSVDGVLSLFRISPKSKEKSKDKDGNSINSASRKTQHERSSSQDCMLDTPSQQNNKNNKKQTTPTKTTTTTVSSRTPAAFSSSSPQLYIHRPSYMVNDEQTPPPIPPLPINYQRSDDESYATETRDQKKQRAISKAVRQAELKRLRIAQEIQREQEEIEVQLKELEARGVLIEKALRGEDENHDSVEPAQNVLNSDEKLLKELLDIWRNITQLKKRDEELSIRQKELQLEHRHAQLKEELNLRLSCNKLDKTSTDVAAEGAILNEMLEIVAKRAALRPTANADLAQSSTDYLPTISTSNAARNVNEGINLSPRRAQKPHDNNESNI